jgi:hypothetical protein
LTFTIRAERQRLDVGDAVDRGVPGDPVAVRLQERVDLGREARVLVPGVGERRDDPAVQVRVGADVDDRSLVVALEVDAVHRARGDEAAMTSSVQVGVGSSLKRSVG